LPAAAVMIAYTDAGQLFLLTELLYRDMALSGQTVS
jgi:hypothetical protein